MNPQLLETSNGYAADAERAAIEFVINAILPDWVPTTALDDDGNSVPVPLADRVRLMREQYEIDIADLKADARTCYICGLEAAAQRPCCSSTAATWAPKSMA